MVDHIPGPADRQRHRALSGESRVRILGVLQDEPTPLGITEITARVHLHPNTVRLQLDQLVEAGLVTSEQQKSDRPGRPRQVYAARPANTGDAPVATDRTRQSQYQLLAEVLVKQLEHSSPEPANEAVAVGRAWGHDLRVDSSPRSSVRAATDGLADLLDGLGFAPRTADSGQAMELHRCPFRQVAEAHSPVVCGIHLGLMQGALDSDDAPVQVSSLEPFVAPGLCLARFDTQQVPPD